PARRPRATPAPSPAPARTSPARTSPPRRGACSTSRTTGSPRATTGPATTPTSGRATPPTASASPARSTSTACEDHQDRHLRGGRGLAPVAVRGRPDGRRAHRLRRVLGRAEPVRRRGRGPGLRGDPDRARPAAGRADLLGPLPDGPPEPGRDRGEGHRGDRARVLRPQGQG